MEKIIHRKKIGKSLNSSVQGVQKVMFWGSESMAVVWEGLTAEERLEDMSKEWRDYSRRKTT